MQHKETYMATATDWPTEKRRPTAPPIRGPIDREIRKYAPPALTVPLVAIADIDDVVTKVTTEAMETIAMAKGIPAWPTTQPNRRNMMTPKMLSMHETKTPSQVPAQKQL